MSHKNEQPPQNDVRHRGVMILPNVVAIYSEVRNARNADDARWQAAENYGVDPNQIHTEEDGSGHDAIVFITACMNSPHDPRDSLNHLL